MPELNNPEMAQCNKFQENAWKKEMCTNCLRARSDHKITATQNVNTKENIEVPPPRKPPRTSVVIKPSQVPSVNRPRSKAPPPPAPLQNTVRPNGVKQNGVIADKEDGKIGLPSNKGQKVTKKPELPRGKPMILPKNVPSTVMKPDYKPNVSKNSILDALRTGETTKVTDNKKLGVSYNKPSVRDKKVQYKNESQKNESDLVSNVALNDDDVYSAEGDYGTPCSVHLSDDSVSKTSSREVSPDVNFEIGNKFKLGKNISEKLSAVQPPELPKSPPPVFKPLPKGSKVGGHKISKKPGTLPINSSDTTSKDSTFKSPSMDLMDDITETLKDMGYGTTFQSDSAGENPENVISPKPKPRIKRKPLPVPGTKRMDEPYEPVAYQTPIDSIPLDESKQYQEEESLYSAPWDQDDVILKAEKKYKKYLRNSKNISQEALNLELSMNQKASKEKKSVQFDRAIDVAEEGNSGSFKRNVAVRRSTGMTAAFEAKLANIQGGLIMGTGKKPIARPSVSAPPPPVEEALTSPTKMKTSENTDKPPMMRTKSDSIFTYGTLVPPGDKHAIKEGSTSSSEGKRSPTPPIGPSDDSGESKTGKSKKSKGSKFSFKKFLGKGKGSKEASDVVMQDTLLEEVEDKHKETAKDETVDREPCKIPQSDSTVSFDVIEAIEQSNRDDNITSDGSDADDICGKDELNEKYMIESVEKLTNTGKRTSRNVTEKLKAAENTSKAITKKEQEKNDLIKDLNKIVAQKKQTEDKLGESMECSPTHGSDTRDNASLESEEIDCSESNEDKSSKSGGKRQSILSRLGDIRKSGRRKSDPRPKKDKERKNSKIDKKDIQFVSAEPMFPGSEGSASPEISDRSECDIKLPTRRKSSRSARQQNSKSVTEATLEASRARIEELGLRKEDRSASVSDSLKDAFEEGFEPSGTHDSTQDLPTPPPVPTHGLNAYEFVAPNNGKGAKTDKIKQSSGSNFKEENLYDVILSKAEIEKQRQLDQQRFSDTSSYSGSSAGSRVEDYMEPINASSRRRPKSRRSKTDIDKEQWVPRVADKLNASIDQPDNTLHISEPNVSSTTSPPVSTIVQPPTTKRLAVNTPATRFFEAHNGDASSSIHSSKEPYVLMYHGESRQDKSSKIEDAFDRIVGMNRISMEQITSHFNRQQETYSEELPNSLKWSDFELLEADPICETCDTLFYRATYLGNDDNKEYILMVTTKSIPQLEHTKRCPNLFHFVGHFQDVVSPPIMALLHDGKSHYESNQAHVGVLNYNSIQTIDDYLETIGQLYKQNTASLERVLCSAFRQLVQGLAFLLETNVQCGELKTDHLFIASYGEENSMLSISPLYLLTTKPGYITGSELSDILREMVRFLESEENLNFKFLRNSKRMTKLLYLLSKETGNCLPKAKELLDFLLWGPSERCVKVLMEGDSDDHEHTFRMWLEIQSSRKLNDLILKMITYNKTYTLTWEENSHITFLHDAPIPQLLDSAKAIYDTDDYL